VHACLLAYVNILKKNSKVIRVSPSIEYIGWSNKSAEGMLKRKKFEGQGYSRSWKVLKFKFLFFSLWKVPKLDIGAEKVLIFVSCGPGKSCHPCNISVMQSPWRWSWNV